MSAKFPRGGSRTFFSSKSINYLPYLLRQPLGKADFFHEGLNWGGLCNNQKAARSLSLHILPEGLSAREI